MKPDNLCKWLGLDPHCWPPDHYALLGLPPGETNLHVIEQRVQERLARLRSYQISHPDEATEGMNRLAQAFIQLSETVAKTQASAAVAVAEPPPVPAATSDDTAIERKTRLDWQAAPPPVRGHAEPPPRPEIPVGILENEPASPQQLAAAEREMIHGLAERSSEAKGGLRTLQDLMDRARQTRQMLIAWGRAGKYLANPKRKLVKPGEKKDFNRRLDALVEVAEHYPAFVGHPGRPGYRVVALAHLVMTPEMYNSMDLPQREHLAEDWALANKILLAHRSYLCRQFKSLRHNGRFGLLLHALRCTFAEHPTVWTSVAVMLAVVAVGSLVTLLVLG